MSGSFRPQRPFVWALIVFFSGVLRRRLPVRMWLPIMCARPSFCAAVSVLRHIRYLFVNWFTIVTTKRNGSFVLKILLNSRCYPKSRQICIPLSSSRTKTDRYIFHNCEYLFALCTDAFRCRVRRLQPRWRRGYAVACRATITPVQIWTLALRFSKCYDAVIVNSVFSMINRNLPKECGRYFLENFG